MSLYSRIKNYFSISKRVPPVEAKDPSMSHYGYSGQSFGYSNQSFGSLSGGAKYPGGLSGDGLGHIIDHWRTRQNARTAYHETPEARAMVDRFADTVVGTGLKIECTPAADLLGITSEQAEEWSADVDERFDLYLKSKQSHRREILTGYQQQRLYQIQQQRDNDIFARFFYSQEKNLMNPLQVDFIDPDQIKGNGYTSTYGNLIDNDDGIIVDSKGREKAYIVLERKKDGTQKFTQIPRIGEKSKRIFMVHGFTPEYSYQSRGYSRLSHALQELQKLTDLSLSAVTKAINQSMISMTVESETESPATNPLASKTLNVAGPRSSVAQFPAQSPPLDSIDQEAQLSPEYISFNETVDRSPGSIGVFNLEGKQKLKPFENKGVADEYDKLADTFLMNLSASSSIPIEVLRMRFSNNYSASRGTLLLFWQVVKIWVAEQVADFENPRFEAWLGGEIAAGRVLAPGWSDPILRRAWLKCNWIGVPMPNIDPQKTAAADRNYIEMGIETQERVARNLNGSSIKSNLQKNKNLFEKTPVPPWQISRSSNLSIVTDEPIDDLSGSLEE